MTLPRTRALRISWRKQLWSATSSDEYEGEAMRAIRWELRVSDAS